MIKRIKTDIRKINNIPMKETIAHIRNTKFSFFSLLN